MHKSKTSLRTTRRRQKLAHIPSEENAEDDDAFTEVTSPRVPRFGLASPVSRIRMSNAPKLKLGLASPVTPKPKRTDAVNKSANESSDQEILSQHPTPSKWNSLLPDYFGSQMDGVTCDVLWDCSSPNAIRHLRRRKKNDNSNVKEIVKLFKAAEPPERSHSPPLLSILRSSLQRHQLRQNASGPTNSKKSKKSSRRRKQNQDPEQQALLDKILRAVELRAANSQSASEPGSSTATECGALAPKEPAEGEDDAIDLDSSWGDDDLFQDILAIQHPELNASGTSTPRCTVSRHEPVADCLNTLDSTAVTQSVVSQQPASLSSTHCDSHNSGVGDNSGIIPPTLVPQGSGLCRTCDVGEIKLLGLCRNPFAVGAATSHGNSLVSPIQRSSVLGKEDVLGSPRSRFRLQRKAANWPKRALIPAAHRPDQAQNANTVHTAQNTELLVNRAGLSHSHLSKVPKGVIGVLSAPQTVNSNLKARTRNSIPLFADDQQVTGLNSNLASSLQTPAVDAPVSTKRNVNINHNIHDGFDDSLPEDVLLQLTEQDESFESQAIYEFPTQAPKKPVCSLMKAPASSHTELFDDIDSEMLASICEFDSFSESPQKGKKDLNPLMHASTSTTDNTSGCMHKGVKQEIVPLAKHAGSVMKKDPSDSKQSRFYGSIAHKPVGDSLDASVSAVKKAGLTFKPKVGSGLSTAISNVNKNGVAGKSVASSSKTSYVQQNSNAAKTAKTVHSPAQRNRSGRPLATIAHSNCLPGSGKAAVAQKKFAFKPVSAATNGRTVPMVNVSSVKPPSANHQIVVDISSVGMYSQDDMGGDDDLLADDALLESQIIAMLDEVESQVSQHAAPNPAVSSPRITGSQDSLQCSQEEIEKKRQAAMQRRFRSSSRIAGKPP